MYFLEDLVSLRYFSNMLPMGHKISEFCGSKKRWIRLLHSLCKDEQLGGQKLNF